jgi:flagellar basal-body rod protein FlgF
MIRGIYSAASGLLAQMARQLAISNNLANLNTPGYRQDLTSLREYPGLDLFRLYDGQAAQVGELGAGVATELGVVDLSQGALVDTGNPLDLAISGPAFFAVQTPEGIRYTRDGSFSRSAQGILVNALGFPVLGEGGTPIQLPDGEVTVDGDGTITAGGQQVGRLLLAEFQPGQLRKAGSNLFEALGAGGTAANSAVNQGFLEMANVDVPQAVVDMMAATRSYEASLRLLQMQDEILSKSVNEIGRTV